MSQLTNFRRRDDGDFQSIMSFIVDGTTTLEVGFDNTMPLAGVLALCQERVTNWQTLHAKDNLDDIDRQLVNLSVDVAG